MICYIIIKTTPRTFTHQVAPSSHITGAASVGSGLQLKPHTLGRSSKPLTIFTVDNTSTLHTCGAWRERRTPYELLRQTNTYRVCNIRNPGGALHVIIVRLETVCSETLTGATLRAPAKFPSVGSSLAANARVGL